MYAFEKTYLIVKNLVIKTPKYGHEFAHVYGLEELTNNYLLKTNNQQEFYFCAVLLKCVLVRNESSVIMMNVI